MNYELLNTIDPGSAVWQGVAKRAQDNHRKILTIAATPYFDRIVADKELKGTSLIDHVTGHKYDLSNHRFFNDVPVPYLTAMTMFQNGSIFAMLDGKPIAREFLYPNTRRVPQDIRYTNILDGTLDYVEEYASDGSVFSNIFYYKGVMQEIDFYNTDGEPVLRFYYAEGDVNFITIEDPKTHKVLVSYDTLIEFQRDQLGKLLKAGDSVTINYMGVELDMLEGTPSHNILRLTESPFDESGAVRGNLEMILKDQISWIHEVQMNLPDFERLSNADMPMGKAKLV